jgi:hypothetical protein
MNLNCVWFDLPYEFMAYSDFGNWNNFSTCKVYDYSIQ